MSSHAKRVPVKENGPSVPINEVAMAFYQQANTYRLHQDNLRWMLFAGYVTFFSALLGFLSLPYGNSKIGDNDGHAILFLVFIIAANLFLFKLAVESYYYNLYKKYVDYCEKASRIVELRF